MAGAVRRDSSRGRRRARRRDSRGVARPLNRRAHGSGAALVRADAEGEGAGTQEDREALAPRQGADAEMDAAHARRMLM
jgi:hypothetical protein